MMQSGKDYGVRVVRAWGMFSVGKIIFPEGGYRSDLLRRGWVELVKAPGTEDKKKSGTRRD